MANVLRAGAPAPARDLRAEYSLHWHWLELRRPEPLTQLRDHTITRGAVKPELSLGF